MSLLNARSVELAFGPEKDYVRHLGYYVAGWDLPNTLGISGDALMYNVPGRMASVGADPRDPARAGTLFLFKSPELAYDRRDPGQPPSLQPVTHGTQQKAQQDRHRQGDQHRFGQVQSRDDDADRRERQHP